LKIAVLTLLIQAGVQAIVRGYVKNRHKLCVQLVKLICSLLKAIFVQ